MSRLWGSPFFWLPITGIAIVAAVFAVRFLAEPTTLRVAVGPEGSADMKLISDLAVELAQDKGRTIKLRLVKTEGTKESAAELDAGHADLAVVRSDVALSTTGLTVAILHRNSVILAAPHTTKLGGIVDLAKKRIGIVRSSPENIRLLDQLLGEYNIDPQALTRVPLEPGEVAEAVKAKRVDVVMVVAPASGALARSVVTAVASGSGREPVFVAIKEAEAIAQRKLVYESQEIVNGLFGGNPPRPAESFNTIAVTYRLMASRRIEDYIVSDFTRRLFTLRMALADKASLADRIEKPDTEDATALPLHPGAAAYFDNNEKSFLDRYDSWFYLGAMGLSGVVSAFAALFAAARARLRRDMLSPIDDLIHLQLAIRVAAHQIELDDAEVKVSSVSTDMLRHTRGGRIDESGLAALSLAMDECRQAIADRRAHLKEAASTSTALSVTGAVHPIA